MSPLADNPSRRGDSTVNLVDTVNLRLLVNSNKYFAVFQWDHR